MVGCFLFTAFLVTIATSFLLSGNSSRSWIGGERSRGRALHSMGAGILMLTLVFTGCSTHRVDKNPDPLVDGMGTYSLPAGDRKIQSRWWEALNDTLLDSLLSEALSENLTLMQARYRIEQAIAADTQAAAVLYPELFGTASGELEWENKDRGDSDVDDNYNM